MARLDLTAPLARGLTEAKSGRCKQEVLSLKIKNESVSRQLQLHSSEGKAVIATLCIAVAMNFPQVDPFACDFIPEPLPAWVDALPLRTDPRFVNDRGLGSPWTEKYPAVRVGLVTQAIPADSDLILKFMTPIGIRPKGQREVGEDAYISYELKENGFMRRLVVDKGSNTPSHFTLDVVSPSADGKQFLAWESKLRTLLGAPTFISRTELPRSRRAYQREVDAYEAIEVPVLDGHNYISMMWVWGVGKPSRFGWDDIKYNDDGLVTEGPTTTIILTYAEETTAVDRKTNRKEKRGRILQIWINPCGVMAG